MGNSKRRLFTGFGATLLVVLGIVIFFQQNFQAVVVSGSSMLPTLKTGQRVWASHAYWLVGSIRKKDIVVIRDEAAGTGFIVKRVAYMPGETVDWYNVPRTWPLANGPFKVPAGSIFVIGDNLLISEDSRMFGPVELNRVVGKVVIRR